MGARIYQKGFSVVELLITLAVAAMAIIIIGTMFGSASRLADGSTDILAANTIAYAKLQKYENYSFASIPFTTDGTAVEDFSSEIPNSIPGPHVGKVFISQQSATLKYVFVRITYNSGPQERILEYGDFIQAGGLGR